jgi:hypothetical protein
MPHHTASGTPTAPSAGTGPTRPSQPPATSTRPWPAAGSWRHPWPAAVAGGVPPPTARVSRQELVLLPSSSSCRHRPRLGAMSRRARSFHPPPSERLVGHEALKLGGRCTARDSHSLRPMKAYGQQHAEREGRLGAGHLRRNSGIDAAGSVRENGQHLDSSLGGHLGTRADSGCCSRGPRQQCLLLAGRGGPSRSGALCLRTSAQSRTCRR